jgi:hypothetical protein
MRRIHYSSGSVLTGDRIARVVLEYAEALALDGRADIVEIPVTLPSGNPGSATLLIGPSSQLASVTEESALAEPNDDRLVGELEDRMRRLGRPLTTPMPSQYADFLSSHEEYE